MLEFKHANQASNFYMNFKSFKKIFLSTVSFLLLSGSSVFAAIDCNTYEPLKTPNPDNPQTYDIRVCVHGDTRGDVLAVDHLSVACTEESFAPLGVQGLFPCEQIANENIPFNINDSQVYPSSSGGYHSCSLIQQINRDIAAIRVEYVGESGQCSFDRIEVKPADYDPVSEGLFSQSTGYNTGSSNPLRCATGGINTALGCIDTTDLGSSIGTIIRIAIGIGGGLALLLMGYGIFIITTSAGIPDKINEGKALITSAAGGLIFMVLSVVIFQLIGVNILGIPGL